MTTPTNFPTKLDFINYHQTRINDVLESLLSINAHPMPTLVEAIHYAVMAPAKRLRPLLVYATGLSLGATHKQLDHAAAAVEFVHTYSLIHDDLPAMDDDDLRRGQPACHIAFGEATAILAGDALQMLATECLCHPSPFLNAQQQLQMNLVLAQASGVNGMVGGQALDLAAEQQHPTITELEIIHSLKTSALFKASIQMGTIAAEQTQQLQLLSEFSEILGLAFQIQDDVLDVIGETEKIGKPVGSDQVNHKATYPSLTSLEDAIKRRNELQQQAHAILASLHLKVPYLNWMIDWVIERDV